MLSTIPDGSAIYLIEHMPQDGDADKADSSGNVEESSLAQTELKEAIDAEEKKLWDAAVMEMGPIIKIILQQLNQT